MWDPWAWGYGALLNISVRLHQWRAPQFALKYPSNTPPPPTGDRCALWGEILGGEGAPLIAFLEPYTCGDELVAQEVE